jgi:hypothetical protein
MASSSDEAFGVLTDAAVPRSNLRNRVPESLPNPRHNNEVTANANHWNGYRGAGLATTNWVQRSPSRSVPRKRGSRACSSRRARLPKASAIPGM